jgi:mannose-6-phosphate isomerase-like protein (cupin superfamily)
VDTAEIPPETLASGVTLVPVLDVAGAAGGRLARRLVTLPAGAAYAGTAGPAGELWFVTSGSGHLEADGGAGGGPAGVPVGPEHGIALPPGAAYRLVADPAPQRNGVLVVDAVTLPGTAGTAGTAAAGREPHVTDQRDSAAEVTGNRRFRVLFGPGTGYPAATQFVGEIPPGRAPDHRHAYDEVVLVLAGEGVVHLVADEPGGMVTVADYPLRPGSCLHLPPGQRHCLENTGTADLRVLGVFHPGGSPAAKAS